MKQTVILRVPIEDDWDAGARLEVFTDFGHGSVDYTRPLLQRGLDLFPGQHGGRGVGVQPVGVGRVGDHKAARPAVGIGSSIVGITPVGTAPSYVEIPVSVPAAFGAWKFAVRAVDGQGNVQSEEAVESTVLVSGTEPPPLRTFALDSYDAIKDRLTFWFSRETE